MSVTTTYSLDSQPYAVLSDPRDLQVVSIPGRLALLQRLTIDIGSGGGNPPNRLRMLVRSVDERVPSGPLRVRVTNLTGVDLVEPRLVEPSRLERPSQFQWVEVGLVATGGFGSGDTADVMVWFGAVEPGVGWEVATPSTGENNPDWVGPIDASDPDIPVFGSLLTFPAGAPALARLVGSTLVPEIGPVSAGVLAPEVLSVPSMPVFASQAGQRGFRSALTRSVVGPSGVSCVVGNATHVLYGVIENANIRKVRRSDNRQVSSVGFAGSGMRAATAHAGFAYFSTAASPAGVWKVGFGSGDAAPAFAGFRALASGENIGQAIANDGTHLYVGTFTSPARIVKVRMSDMVRIGAITLSANENEIIGMAVTGTTLWAVCNTDPVRLIEINLTTFARTSGTQITQTPDMVVAPPIVFVSDAGRGRSISINPAGTFAAVGTSSGRVLRVDLSAKITTGVSSALASSPDLRAVKIDSQSEYVYGLADINPAAMYRWWFASPNSALPSAGELTMPAGNNGGLALDITDRQIFAGFRTPTFTRVDTAGALVSQLNRSTLAGRVLSDVPYFEGENPVGVVVDQLDVFDAGDLYVATSFRPARVAKYETNAIGGPPGSRLASVSLPATPTCMVGDATHLFVPMLGVAGQVRKLDKTDLSTTSTLTLAAGEDNPACVTQTATDLFVGTDTVPGCSVKIEKSTNTRTSGLVLNAGEGPLRGAVSDSTHVYYVTGSTPAQVIKVLAVDNTRVGAITLGPNEGPGGSITLTDGSLYVLTDSLPAHVIEVDVATFLRATSVTLNASENNGSVILSDDGDVWAGLATPQGRVVRLGETLQATGESYAIQFQSQTELSQGLSRARNLREDADVAVQFGYQPPPPQNVVVSTTDVADNSGCLSGVQISWEMPDNSCAVVTESGFVEIQRQIGGGAWQPVFNIFGEAVAQAIDVEVGRNVVNRYRLRITNDAGFVSDWSSPVEVFVESECCGYTFASNQVPNLAVWYDDIVSRVYQFPEDVEYIEFEGRDGSVPFRVDADRLDTFETELMIAGFGVSGGTADSKTLPETGRLLFDPLLKLSGNQRFDSGLLLRLPHLAVADNKGNVWFALVEADAGSTVASAGRFSITVRVREVARTPRPTVVTASGVFESVQDSVEDGESGSQGGFGGEFGQLLLDPDNLLGS